MDLTSEDASASPSRTDNGQGERGIAGRVDRPSEGNPGCCAKLDVAEEQAPTTAGLEACGRLLGLMTFRSGGGVVVRRGPDVRLALRHGNLPRVGGCPPPSGALATRRRWGRDCLLRRTHSTIAPWTVMIQVPPALSVSVRMGMHPIRATARPTQSMG